MSSGSHAINEAVAVLLVVGTGEADIARVVDPVVIGVAAGLRAHRAGVAGVAEAVVVDIGLVGIRGERAVVLGIRNAVSIEVRARLRSGVLDPEDLVTSCEDERREGCLHPPPYV